MKRLRMILFPPRRPLRWVLPLAVLTGLVLLQCLAPQWAGRAEAWTVDARFLLRGPETPRNPIVIVAIDEDSVQSLGDDLMGQNVRTWPRANWATLVSRIAAGRPRLIGLDVVFDIPGWDTGGDNALAAAIQSAGNVVLAANWDQREAGGQILRLFRPPVEVLAQAAVGVGVVNFPLDVDGAVRRLTLLYPYAGKSYPTLALVAAVLYQGAPVDVPPIDLGNDLSLFLHIRGPQKTFATIPMDQVWFAEVDPQTWRDAIVLVGYTTQLEQDRHLAPFAREVRMPGVELHANAVDTLLAGDWLHRVPDWLPPVLVGTLGLLALVALSLRRPWVGLVATGSALLLYLLAAGLSFVHADLLLPVIAPTISAVLVAGSAQAERMIFAEREKRLMRRRFAGVMSAERLQAVMDNWEDLLRPERRLKPAAVLFADIRGFTHATETLMAQERTGEMVDFLTAYLDAMAEAVFAEGGVIYRMLGDGLLILFGLPQALPNYGLCAVRGALRMAQAAEQLRAQWPLQGELEFGMGIGLNAGLMTDGIVGTGRQLDYSVIGDAVNTAARIEAHCKVAMETPRPAGGTVPEDVAILLGWDLYEQVRDAVLVDESIPPFPARGKSDPVRVVRLLWGNAVGSGLDVVLPAVRALGQFILPGYAVVQSLSPDGQLLIVAYKQGEGTVNTLYYDVAAGQEVGPPAWLVDTPAASFSCMRFSPDGRQIAFLQSGSSSTQVCFANWPDGPPTCIDGSDDYYGCPYWSPDGQWALFYRSPKGGASAFNLYRVRPDGSELAALTSGEPSKSGPAWSPDGARVAYTAAPSSWQGEIRPAGELWVMDADGGNARRLMENTHPYGRAAWNPEGQGLVVAGWQDGAANGLWLVSLDGSTPTAVPGTAALQPSGALWSPSLTGWPLLLNASTGPNNDIPTLYVARGDGSDPVALANLSTGPLWTADGQTAALVSVDGSLSDLAQITSTVYVVRTEPGFYPLW